MRRQVPKSRTAPREQATIPLRAVLQNLRGPSMKSVLSDLTASIAAVRNAREFLNADAKHECDMVLARFDAVFHPNFSPRKFAARLAAQATRLQKALGPIPSHRVAKKIPSTRPSRRKSRLHSDE